MYNNNQGGPHAGPSNMLPLSPSQMHIVQHSQQSPQPQRTPTTSATSTSRKRRKADDFNETRRGSPSEPRRLRRSHEACARCRGKKIKCDAKVPRCSACAAAQVECFQEERAGFEGGRGGVIPRGHTERVERLLSQCDALLKRKITGFSLDALEEHLSREGIDPAVGLVSFSSSDFPYPSLPTGMFPSNPATMAPSPGYPPLPPSMLPQFSLPPAPPGTFNPHLHAQAQQPFPLPLDQPGIALLSDVPGRDPKANDLSTMQSLAKNFGVSAAILNDLKLGNGVVDGEDLAVGSAGLFSGRDQFNSYHPRDPSRWCQISIRCFPPLPVPLAEPIPNVPAVSIWLPKDREDARRMVHVYFDRLNPHRPILLKTRFLAEFEDLYAQTSPFFDPGFLCTLYLVLSLGSLSDLQRKWKDMPDNEVPPVDISKRQELMPPGWPDHEDLVRMALSIKSSLLVSVSSLQALLLLHWYLYTEHQGSLWRLVGNLVRLATELGLHHDPTNQIGATSGEKTFTMEEAQLRVRLWGIVMLHDRATSILLGRPLAISPSDYNTPKPSRMTDLSRPRMDDFSEHFELSGHISEIEADIVNHLYSPATQSGEMVYKNATRIIKSMIDFRRHLPEKYKFFFEGTENWLLEEKGKLLDGMDYDMGLTLLKLNMARILLLRAVFSMKDLSYAQRRKALVDAIVTSHNTIVIHQKLAAFPEVSFFSSAVPLHVSAMVILYGHMSRSDRLSKQTALEDVRLSLDMLPAFRWHWQPKDVDDGQPLIAKLAERVMDVPLDMAKSPARPSLLPEPTWEEDISGAAQSEHAPPPTQAPGPEIVYGPQPAPGSGPAMADVPQELFFPFGSSGVVGSSTSQGYEALLGNASNNEGESSIWLSGHETQ